VHAIGPAGTIEWTFAISNARDYAGMAHWLHGVALGAGRLYVAMFDTLLALGD